MEAFNRVEKLVVNITDYAETRFNLVVLDAQDKFTNAVSSIVVSIIGIVLMFFILFFSSIGMAMWINQYFQSAFIGFFYIAGFYFLIALLVILTRAKLIKTPIVNRLLKKMNFHENN